MAILDDAWVMDTEMNADQWLYMASYRDMHSFSMVV